jgi:hypothetical protein
LYWSVRSVVSVNSRTSDPASFTIARRSVSLNRRTSMLSFWRA